MLFVLLACGEDGGSMADETSASGTSGQSASSNAAPPILDLADDPDLGEGFVVWESNRSGPWRLWRRTFDGSPPHQLTSEDGPRQHCCAHISPDGSRLVYLSLPDGAERYPVDGASGELRLLPLKPDSAAGGEVATLTTVLATSARTYFEHRAAVWRDDRHLIYIDGEGRTQERDVDTGTTRLLVKQGPAGRGWLLDPTLHFAVEGTPRFSSYDAAQLTVRPERSLGGCQPYFTHDGRFGVWLAGAGGPIRRLELNSGLSADLLRKGDPRLPAPWRYLYFPMLSADNAFLVWGASDGTHDHQRADYEIFLAETDSRTLELVGEPRRVTFDSATDRFPDVWARPLELGRQRGEAPLRVELTAPGDGWRWDFSDGDGESDGSSPAHTYTRAGRYGVVARRGGEELRGTVQVAPSRPPVLMQAEVRNDGAALWLQFDEPVDLSDATASLESGIAIVGTTSQGDTNWLLRLAAPLTSEDTLRLEGVVDRAQQPNVMTTTFVTFAASRWPADSEGLIFLWRAGDRRNLVQDPVEGGEHATLLEPKEEAWLDRHFAMVTRGGAFVADLGTMDRLYHGARLSNELSLELTVEAAADKAMLEESAPHEASPGDGTVFAFGGGGKLNTSLSQERGRWIFRLRTSSSSRAAPPPLDLGVVTPGRAQHLMIAYTPGHFRGWLDGRLTVESRDMVGDFFPWQRRALVFGRQWPEERPWFGRIWGVAAWNRELSEDEVAEELRRSKLDKGEAEPLPSRRMRGTLLARASIPSLEDISPYREALAVFEYRVEEVLAGEMELPTVRVAHRVWLDGEATAISRLPTGQGVVLDLQPFLDQPQLESLYLSQDLPNAASGPLYFSDRIRP